MTAKKGSTGNISCKHEYLVGRWEFNSKEQKAVAFFCGKCLEWADANRIDKAEAGKAV